MEIFGVPYYPFPREVADVEVEFVESASQSSTKKSLTLRLFPGMAGLLLIGATFNAPGFTDPGHGATPADETATRITQSVDPSKITDPYLTPKPNVLIPADVSVGMSTRVRVPYRTQFDGTAWEGGNCGPASIGMAMGAFSYDESTDSIRQSINGFTGDWSTESGTSWESLKRAVEERGFAVDGLYAQGGGYHFWTMDDLLHQTRQGRPVVVLVKYQYLPGHETATWYGDHYVVFLGMTPDGKVVYHDPAFRNGGKEGRSVTVDQAVFERAWLKSWTGLRQTAMAVYPAG